MSTLTVGILGYGRIGRSTAQKLNGFGARVLAYTRSPKQEPGVEFVSMDRLLRECDAVIVHIPLTPDTKHLFESRAARFDEEGRVHRERQPWGCRSIRTL